MKTFKGINERPKHYADGVPEDIQAQLPTYKRLILDVLGLSRANTGSEAVDMFHLAQKIKTSTDNDYGFEDAEYRILREKIEGNPANLSANYFAQLVIKMKEAE